MGTPQREGKSRSGAGPSDAALVVGARAREQWAEEALFRRYTPMAHALAYRLLGSDEDAHDTVQDAFYDAFTHLDRLAEPAAFSTWLGTIVVRRAYRVLRRRRLFARLGFSVEKPVDVDELSIGPDAPQEAVAELRRIYARMHEMPALERVVLVLRRIEGHEVEDIAEQVGVSASTVKRRLRSALAMLERERGGHA